MTTVRRQIDDRWNPCYGGAISNVGACWIRNADNRCFSVKEHVGDEYTLTSNGLEIQVRTEDLPEQFRPT